MVKLCPLDVTGVLKEINVAHMKEYIKALKKEVSNKEIAKLSVAEFKALVIKTLTEMVELGRKMKEEMKAH